MNKFGFPRTKAKTVKRFILPEGKSFQTGDVVQLKQPSGKYQGTHIGTVSIRATGQFDIFIRKGQKITSNVKKFTKLYSFNGYNVQSQWVSSV